MNVFYALHQIGLDLKKMTRIVWTNAAKRELVPFRTSLQQKTSLHFVNCEYSI